MSVVRVDPDFKPEFLAQALSLAVTSTVRTSPNPRVGCVIVADGTVVGRGVTRVPGQAHAEVVALSEAGELAKGAHMYVTLEPCCHVGRTPPCTEAIRASGIAKVFIGSIDPNPLVCGAGIDFLVANGISAFLIDDAACTEHLAPFRRFIQHKRPWVHLKVASTLDGQLATSTGSSKWITGQAARAQAHRIRAQSDGVIVGIGTVLADDPRLDVREVAGTSPIAIVLDTHLRMPLDRRCLCPGTLIFHGPSVDAQKREALTTKFGVSLIEVSCSETGRLDLASVLRKLHERQMVNVMVEGGGTLVSAFLNEKLADELSVFFAPKLFGAGISWAQAELARVASDAVVLSQVSTMTLGDDVYIRGALSYAEGSED